MYSFIFVYLLLFFFWLACMPFFLDFFFFRISIISNFTLFFALFISTSWPPSLIMFLASNLLYIFHVLSLSLTLCAFLVSPTIYPSNSIFIFKCFVPRNVNRKQYTRNLMHNLKWNEEINNIFILFFQRSNQHSLIYIHRKNM